MDKINNNNPLVVIPFPNSSDNEKHTHRNREKVAENMDTLFQELKADMREREIRSEQRYKEQQELLLNEIDKRLNAELSSIKKDVQSLKSSTLKWGVGLIVSIIIAFIGVLPQVINIIVDLVKLIPNP